MKSLSDAVRDFLRLEAAGGVLLFIAASAIATAFPAGAKMYQIWVSAAKAGLAVTLFLIGASLTRETLRSVGWRPFAMGVTLWLIVSVSALFLITRFG